MQTGNEEVKLFLLADDMLYIQKILKNPHTHTQTTGANK